MKKAKVTMRNWEPYVYDGEYNLSGTADVHPRLGRNVYVATTSTLVKASLEEAYDLGANGVQTFVRIIFPLSLPGMFSGITMVFVPALTTFVISKILGGSKILLIGNVIEQEFTQTGNWNLGSGLSIVLMLFIIFNMVISVITDKEGEANTL